MIWLNKVKGSLYTLFFIALNVIYLVIELSFNARILDVSAAFSPATDFSQLELYGRSISASGATLFAWRLLVPSWSSISLLNIILKFLLIALIVFPVVFIGQKTLVDDLVNQSSNETRRTAEILSLLKFGIANGFVEIDELAVDEMVLQTAEGKMFITLSGLLAYNSRNMREVLERELEKIAGYAIATQQTETSVQLYKSYLYVSNQIMDDCFDDLFTDRLKPLLAHQIDQATRQHHFYLVRRHPVLGVISFVPGQIDDLDFISLANSFPHIRNGKRIVLIDLSPIIRIDQY